MAGGVEEPDLHSQPVNGIRLVLLKTAQTPTDTALQFGLEWEGQKRMVHHTAPITMNYALREALRLVDEEGLEPRFARHRRNAELMWDGLAALDLTPHVALDHRLPSLTTVSVPDGVDEAAVRRRLLEEYGIEISGGLGALKGKVWRIGLMGYSSSEVNVVTLLGALERILHG